MAEQTPEVERQNSAATGLERLNAANRARLPAPPTTPATQTLANGAVIDRAGKVIYTPPTPADRGQIAR
jgi:hypothetical protein